MTSHLVLLLVDGGFQVGNHTFICANNNQNWTRGASQVDSGPPSAKDRGGGMDLPGSRWVLSGLVPVRQGFLDPVRLHGHPTGHWRALSDAVSSDVKGSASVLQGATANGNRIAIFRMFAPPAFCQCQSSTGARPVS